MKRKFSLFAVAASLMIIFSLCGCSSDVQPDSGEPESPAQTDGNIPDNVITQPYSEAASQPTQPTRPTDSSPDGTETDTPDISETPPESQSSSSEPAEDIPEDGMRAMSALLRLNSDRIHISFTQISSYDGESLFSVEREMYIDGDTKVYINDSIRTVIHDGFTTVIDTDRGIYYTYDGVEDYGLNFGYDSKKYKLLSVEEGDGELTEVYSVEGEGLTSSWSFYDSGTVKVADRKVDGNAFDLFEIHTVDESIDGMDLSVPQNYIMVDPDEFGF